MGMLPSDWCGRDLDAVATVGVTSMHKAVVTSLLEPAVTSAAVTLAFGGVISFISGV